MKERIKKIWNNICDFYKRIVIRPQYLIPAVTSIIVAYSFSALNRSVSVDDLGQYMYYGSENLKIAGTRWGHVLLNRIFQTVEFTPFVDKFFNMIFIFISATLFCLILDNIKKSDNIWKYAAVSCIWTCFPLINESFEFRESMIIFADFVIMFGCVIYEQLNDEFDWKNILLAGVVLSPVMAGYESVMFSYITVVLIILYLNHLKNENGTYRWFMEGIRYALPMIIALILRYVIGFGLIFITGVEYQQNGSTGIKRFDQGVKKSIIQILYNGWYYVIRALSYMPAAEFVAAFIVFVIIVIRNGIKDKVSMFLGLMMFVSVFTLSILQGNWLRYITAVPVNVFVVFVSYLFADCFENITKFHLNIVVIVLLLFIGLRQSIYTHELLALNNQRSDNEAYIARTIGYRLYSEFDKDKTVIFCGQYQMGAFIEDQVTIKDGTVADTVENFVRSLTGHEEKPGKIKYIYSNINSHLNWAEHAFEGKMMQRYLSYYGFDINVPEVIEGDEKEYLLCYEEVAVSEGMKPLDIKDMGDYILVYLGPTVDNEME